MQLSIKEKQQRLPHEWHTKNEHPFTHYTKGSKYKAWWQCLTCGHEWQATVCNRIGRGSGCPKCWAVNKRGNKNCRWTGYGEISGRQWHCLKKEATKERRNCRRKTERETLPFNITIEYIWNLFLEQNRRCALSGRLLIMRGKVNGKLIGNASLDRIDSSKGYVEGNVQWIDKKLQFTKRNLSDQEFIAICESVAMYQAKKTLPPSFKEWTDKKLKSAIGQAI